MNDTFYYKWKIKQVKCEVKKNTLEGVNDERYRRVFAGCEVLLIARPDPSSREGGGVDWSSTYETYYFYEITSFCVMCNANMFRVSSASHGHLSFFNLSAVLKSPENMCLFSSFLLSYRNLINIIYMNKSMNAYTYSHFDSVV